jgi:Arc/MetJ family transcription regulator
MLSLHIEDSIPLRTNIEIDDELMQQAMVATHTSTKKAAVEHALRQVVQMKRQGEAVEKLWGLGTWVGPKDDWFAPDPLQGDVAQSDSASPGTSDSGNLQTDELTAAAP